MLSLSASYKHFQPDCHLDPGVAFGNLFKQQTMNSHTRRPAQQGACIHTALFRARLAFLMLFFAIQCSQAAGPVIAWGGNYRGQCAVPPTMTNCIAVSAGRYHSVALDASGTVTTWGDNSYGQLNMPANLTNVVSIAAGAFHTMALKADGTVVCWGYGSYGQTSVPAGLSNVVAIAAGIYHSMALRADGSVVAWGYFYNYYGGNPVPISVPQGLLNVVAIAAGGSENLALRADGTAIGWRSSTTDTTVASFTNIVAIAGGFSHGLALKIDGTVLAWGNDSSGQTNIPPGLSNVVSIATSCSSLQNVAVKADGSLVPWGQYYNGTNEVPAVVPPGVTNPAALAVGCDHVLAISGSAAPVILTPLTHRTVLYGSTVLLNAGAAGALPLSYQWSFNGNSLPGATDTTLVLTSVDLSQAGVYSLVVSNAYGTASSSNQLDVLPLWITAQPQNQSALLHSSPGFTVSATGPAPFSFQWLFNHVPLPGATASSLVLTNVHIGQEGTYSVMVSNPIGTVTSADATLSLRQVVVWGGNTNGETNIPLGLTNVTALAGGDYHCLALRSDSTVAAWGSNTYAQTNVPGALTNALQISAGDYHSVALLPDGTLRLWGTLFVTSTNLPPSATNLAVLGVGPGAQHLFALRTDGSLFAWGGLNGESTIPPSVSNAVAIAAGGAFSVAVRADGSVAVWGDNTGGQANVPPSATNIVAAAAGWNHVSALRADGTLLTWGSLLYPPPGATNIVDVACGANHVIAVRRDGTLWTFGNNSYGQTTVPPGMTNISGIAGTYYSSLAAVGDGPPVFAAPLVDRSVVSGATVYFRALAHGALPISYQWTFYGTNVPGATNSIFSVPAIQPGQAGYCSVTASNAFGVTTSRQCFVSVIPMMLISQPQSQAAYVGENVTFTILAVGQGPLAYQWHFNGVDISGATVSSLVLTNVQETDAGLYSVTVTNSYASLLSSNAVLAVTPILITSQPLSQSIFPGGTATVSAAAQASSPVSFQWLFNGTALPGATGTALTLTNVQYNQGGIYSVALTTSSAATNTTGAILSVVPVAAWGENILGDTVVPAGLSNVAALSAGLEASLALKADGTIVGWGDPTVAAPPSGLSNVMALAAGLSLGVAVKSDGTVTAWGGNSLGQTNVPASLTNAIAVAAGEDHALALKSDGTVIAWGRNLEGETNVPSWLSNVVAVAAGDFFSLALRCDGTVVAWGSNLSSQTNVPPGLSNAVAIAGGSAHSLALLDNGQVASWGSSGFGQGSLNVTDAVAIAAGYEFSMALRSDGSLVAKGYPWDGQTNLPPGLGNVSAIAAGDYHNLALVANGPPSQFPPPTNPVLSSGIFRVSVQSRAGRVYRLEYKNSLSDAAWTPLPLVAGTGITLMLTDAAAPSSQRFYRLRQW